MDFDLLTVLLIFHILICIVYFLFFLRKKRVRRCLFVVMLFLPYLWIVFFVSGYSFLYLSKRKKPIDKDGLIMSNEEDLNFMDRSKDIESNIIPVEEALILNDSSVKRQMVIEIAKRNPAGYLDKLKMALLSEDSETAHYAASSISQLKRTTDKKLREAKKAYEKKPGSLEAKLEYIEILDFVIKSDMNVDVVTKEYIHDIIEVLKYHIHTCEVVKEVDYEMMIEYLIKAHNFRTARLWAYEFEGVFDEIEAPLVYQLKIAFLTKDEIEFKRTLDELEQAEFFVSKKTMDMVEFWRSNI